MANTVPPMAATSSPNPLSALQVSGDEQKKRDDFQNLLWFFINKWEKTASRWRVANYILVTGSVIGNIIGTITVLSNALAGQLLPLGILVGLPTIVFAIDQGFRVGSNDNWYRWSADKYRELVDDYNFRTLPLSEALDRKKAIDQEMLKTRPLLSILSKPQAPG